MIDTAVMAGFIPPVHVLFFQEGMDALNKSGHDNGGLLLTWISSLDRAFFPAIC